MDFMSMVTDRFLPFVAAYGISLREVGPSDVIAYSPRITLWVFAGREGLDVSCVKKADDGKWYEYPMGPFLVKRSKPGPKSVLEVGDEREARLGAELQSYAAALASDCADVLRGESGWMSEYPWTPIRVAGPLAKTLDELDVV